MQLSNLTPRGAQRGHTLFELVLAALLLGLLVITLAPGMRLGLAADKRKYIEEQTAINQKVAQALVAQAEASPTRALPAPYSNPGSRVYSSILNPATTTGLGAELRSRGVPPPQFNDDGTSVQRVRVYQRATTISQLWVPLQGIVGPTVDIEYEYGLVYLTDCPKAKACNAASHPRDSSNVAHTTLTRLNYSTYAPLSSDVAVTSFSTLPLHQKLIGRLGENLITLRDTLKGHAKTWNRVCGNPDPFYTGGDGKYVGFNNMPVPACLVSDASDLYGAWHVGSGVAALQANMGCWDGWYTLDPSIAGGDFTSGSMLSTLGLDPVKYGRTPWGGTIEYCADYEPKAANDATIDLAPHYAAVRFRRHVSLAETGTMDGLAETDVVIISW